MRQSQRGLGLVVLLLFYAAVLALVLLIYAAINAWTCAQRWKHSGLPTTWGIGQGCLVQTPAGRWIPDDRVRDVDLGPPRAGEKKPDVPTKPTNLT